MRKIGKYVIIKEEELKDVEYDLQVAMDMCGHSVGRLILNSCGEKFEWKEHSDNVFEIWGKIKDVFVRLRDYC